MVLMALIMALLQIFVIDQLGTFAVGIVLIEVVIYSFRYEANLLELLSGTAVYGLVISSFLPVKESLIRYIGLLLATLVAIIVIKVLNSSKYRIGARRIETFLFALIFSAIYWIIPWFGLITRIDPLNMISTIIRSTGVGIIMFVFADLSFRLINGRASDGS